MSICYNTHFNFPLSQGCISRNVNMCGCLSRNVNMCKLIISYLKASVIFHQSIKFK